MYDPTSLMVQALQGRTEPTPAASGMQLAGDVVPFTGGTTWTNPGGATKTAQEIMAAALRRRRAEELNPNPQNVIPLKRPE